MVDRSIIIAKATGIEKCLERINKKCSASLELFKNDEDSQDIILFNLLQAIQGCVDLAAHVVSDEGYGMAGSLREFFYLLQEQGIITGELAYRLAGAVGFRNLVAHEYAALDLAEVYAVATVGIRDLEEFLGVMVRRFA